MWWWLSHLQGNRATPDEDHDMWCKLQKKLVHGAWIQFVFHAYVTIFGFGWTNMLEVIIWMLDATYANDIKCKDVVSMFEWKADYCRCDLKASQHVNQTQKDRELWGHKCTTATCNSIKLEMPIWELQVKWISKPCWLRHDLKFEKLLVWGVFECLVAKQPTGKPALRLKHQENNQSICFTIHSDSNPVPQEGEKERERKRNKERTVISRSLSLYLRTSPAHRFTRWKHTNTRTHARTHTQPDHRLQIRLHFLIK